MWPFNKRHNVIVIGADSMLGHDLVEFLRKKSMQKDSRIGNVLPLMHKDYDITWLENKASSHDKLASILRNSENDYIDYDIVVNCAAYTDTYKIESEYDARLTSYAVNAIGPKNLAILCKCYNKKLIHISTDYVFSDYLLSKESIVYKDTLQRIRLGTATPSGSLAIFAFGTYAAPFPVNIYGTHKLIGEKLVRDYLPKKSAIIRTSWLYGHHKQKSIVHKVAKKINDAIADGKDYIEWTSNENFSLLTCVNDLCHMIYNTIRFNLNGICHGCGASYKEMHVASSFMFADAILSAMKAVNGKKYNSFYIKDVLPKVDPNPLQMRYPGFSRMQQYPEKMYDNMNRTWYQSLQQFVADERFKVFVA